MTYSLDKRGACSILGHEAVVLTAYKDAAGVWTNGPGLTSMSGFKVYPGQRLTLSQALDGFKAKIGKYEDRVRRAIKRDITQDTHNGFTSTDFNTGAIISGSIDDKWNAGDKAAAMATLRRYVNAGGKRLRGLEIRRREEEAIIMNGVYPRRPILLYEVYGKKPRTLNPEHVAWNEPAKELPITVSPEKFRIPAPAPISEQPGFIAWAISTIQKIARWFNEPVTA